MPAERPVDAAMSEQRPEKETVRGLWLQQVINYDQAFPEDQGEPLYLTLSGAEARDVRAVIHAGVVDLTETGAIAREDAHKIVAVERSPSAVLALNREFRGLKI